MSRDPSDKINPDKVQPKGGIEGERRIEPDRSQFQSYMQEPAAAPQGGEESSQAKGITPLELPREGLKPSTAGPSIESVIGQVDNAQGTLNNVRTQLDTPNLKFKRSHQYLLRNKLNEANNHIRSAANKVGAESPTPTRVPPGAGPIEKFIGMVTDGQNQLLTAKQKLAEMKLKGGHLQPGEYMLIQVKLAQAQQELEYSSMLLSSVVGMIKTTINIQI